MRTSGGGGQDFGHMQTGVINWQYMAPKESTRGHPMIPEFFVSTIMFLVGLYPTCLWLNSKNKGSIRGHRTSHLDKKKLPLASMYNRAKFYPSTQNITAWVRSETNEVLYSRYRTRKRHLTYLIVEVI